MLELKSDDDFSVAIHVAPLAVFDGWGHSLRIVLRKKSPVGKPSRGDEFAVLVDQTTLGWVAGNCAICGKRAREIKSRCNDDAVPGQISPLAVILKRDWALRLAWGLTECRQCQTHL
jgi:hypothetical protein